jgi:hypothetical protein
MSTCSIIKMQCMGILHHLTYTEQNVVQATFLFWKHEPWLQDMTAQNKKCMYRRSGNNIRTINNNKINFRNKKDSLMDPEYVTSLLCME